VQDTPAEWARLNGAVKVYEVNKVRKKWTLAVIRNAIWSYVGNFVGVLGEHFMVSDA